MIKVTLYKVLGYYIRMQLPRNATHTFTYTNKTRSHTVRAARAGYKCLIVSGGTNNNLSTGLMVVILVGVVTGVFLCFALMAVCYRYSNSENRLPAIKACHLRLRRNSWLAG